MSLYKSSGNNFLQRSIAPASSLLGAFEAVFDFSGIVCHTIATQSHKIEIQFSDDGATPIKTVDISDDNHSYVMASFFRVKITNSSALASIVDVHTYLTQNGITTASATSDQQMQQTNLLTSLGVKQDTAQATQVQAKQELINLNAKLPTSLGVKPTTGSLSVVIAPDSNPIPVSVDEIALPSNASTESTLAQVKALTEVGNATRTAGLGSIDTRLQGWNSAIDSIATTSQATASRLPASLGQKTTAQSLSICFSSDSTGMAITSNNPLLVKSEQYGSFSNLANNATLGPTSSTTSLNIQQYAYLHGFYEDTVASGVYSYPSLEFSIDNVTFYPANTIYLNSGSTTDPKRRAVLNKTEVAGINYVRVKNSSPTDTYTGVTVSIFGASLG